MIQNGYSIAVGDTGGTTTYAFSGGPGKLSLVSTSGAIELSTTTLVATGPVYLDASHTLSVSESGGRIVFSSSSGGVLASLDGSGNFRTKGTLLGSVAP